MPSGADLPSVALSASLAAEAARTDFAALPAEVRRMVRHCVLDGLGVAIAGAREPLVDILVADALAEDPPGGASLLGRPETLSPTAAACVNGAIAHALDYDDVNMAIPGHPSVVLLPALFALAEGRRASGRGPRSAHGGPRPAPAAAPVSGKAFVTAFVAGYELACRVGLALAPAHYRRGFHATATIGGLGAAAACARLLGLDADTTVHALGIAATRAAGLKAMFGTMCKPLHAGEAAASGLRAARLAARGFTSRVDAIEAPQGFAATHGEIFAPHAALAPAPRGHHLLDNLFKFHAACYYTHAAIQAALELREAHGLVPDAIARVVLHLDPVCDSTCNVPAPRTGLETKFSIRHLAAMALAGVDTAGLAVYDEATAADPVLAALRERIGTEFRVDGPDTRSEVDVWLHDGRRFRATADAGLAEADLERQEARLLRKFDALVVPVLGAVQSQVLRDMILGLEHLDDVTALLRASVPAGVPGTSAGAPPRSPLSSESPCNPT